MIMLGGIAYPLSILIKRFTGISGQMNLYARMGKRCWSANI